MEDTQRVSSEEAGDDGIGVIVEAEQVVGGLFYDDDADRPLKFHVQKHLGSTGEVVAQLVQENGGQVLPKVPLSGYVLIDPASSKGQKVLDRWDDPDKPDRHFVCYTFVPASIAYGELLSLKEMRGAFPLFVQNGLPAPIYLHQSLGHMRKQGLIKDITKYGGRVVASAATARVIIADDTQPAFETLVNRHEHSPIHVEPPEWVASCITRKKYDHDVAMPKAVGGRKVGAARQEYTQEDDDLLAEYIARRLPDKAMRGRTGNQLYKELCERLDLYPWAERHPWESWRNRYKTHRPRIDSMIEEFVQKNPQPIGAKGQYWVTSSKAEARRAVRRLNQTTGGPSQSTSDEERGDDRDPRPPKRRKTSREDTPPSGAETAESMMRRFLASNTN